MSSQKCLEICRACLDKHGKKEMKFLYEDDNVNIAEKFSNFTSLELNSMDKMPSFICNECYNKLIDYNTFRLKCISSDNHLRNSLVPIKLEPTNSELQTESNSSIFHTTYFTNNPKRKHNTKIKENKNLKFDIDNPVKAETYVSISSNCDKKTDVDITKTTEANISRRYKLTQLIFECDICNQRFYKKHRLEAHLRVHQGLKPFECKTCGQEFRKWVSYTAHNKYKHSNFEEKRFKCDVDGCDKTYKLEKYMLDHKKFIHTDYLATKPSVQFICELCGKSFRKKISLKKHTFVHTRESEFSCQLCPKKFPTKYKLKDHMLRHEGIRPHVCSFCGMRKTTLRELKIHVNLHTKEKTFSCDQCPSVFSSLNNLWRHIKIIHRGIRAFTCPHCQRSFGKAETLKHHVMIHTGEKPHRCDICDRRFIQVVALKRHRKTHNKISLEHLIS